MNFLRTRRTARRSPAARGFRPRIEAIEARQLMAGNFLQGFATAGGAPLVGATVALYSIPGNVQVGDAQHTGADGGYSFSGLGKGQYRLVETPPVGYMNTASRALSQLDQVTASTSSSIDVTVGDPSTSPPWLLNTAGSNKEGVYYTAPDSLGLPRLHHSAVGSLNVNVVETDLAYTSPTFTTFCVDVNRDIYPDPFAHGYPNTNLPYTLKPLDQALLASAGTTAANAGRIAYLFNHHAQDALTVSQSAGLQVAIWELEYDRSATDLTAGSFQLATGTDPAAITAALGYLAESAGHSEKAAYLDGMPGDTGSQGLIAASEFDFDNAVKPAQIQGTVFQDFNADCVQQVGAGEVGLPGVIVTLTGIGGGPVTDLGGHAVAPAITDATGQYHFGNLAPGTYIVTEGAIPAADGTFTHEGQTSTTSGAVTTAPRVVSNIVLNAGATSTDNFCETQPAGASLARGQTATIGFWHNKNGQALIQSLNGGPTATALGNYLATSFPNLYGPTAGPNNLTGKTNTQVAAYFLTLFNQTGPKTAAQILGTALAAYSTNSSLAGGTMAAQYGFTVNSKGTGNSTYDVGTSLAPYGGPTGKVTIYQLLSFANARSSNGIIGGSNSSLSNLFNTIFDGINQGGDI